MTGLLTPTHIAIVLIVGLLLFGPKRLPQAGRALGHGIREFKDAVVGHDEATALEPPDPLRAASTPANPDPPA